MKGMKMTMEVEGKMMMVVVVVEEDHYYPFQDYHHFILSCSWCIFIHWFLHLNHHKPMREMTWKILKGEWMIKVEMKIQVTFFHFFFLALNLQKPPNARNCRVWADKDCRCTFGAKVNFIVNWKFGFNLTCP